MEGDNISVPKVSRNGNTGEHTTEHAAGLGQTEDKGNSSGKHSIL